MIITHHSAAFVKVQQGDLIFAFNPINRSFDSKAQKFGANVALVSLRDPRFDGVDNVTFGAKEPFVIDGPGEYEIGGTFVRGFESVGPDSKINTIFTTTIDGIKLCHLGGLAQAELSEKVLEEIGGIDILFVPIGKEFLSAKAANKLATAMEAKMIIPVLDDNGEELKAFLKESGGDGSETDKLTIKKKDLDNKEGEVVVIKS